MKKTNLKWLFLCLSIILLEIIIFYFSNMNTYESNGKSKIFISKMVDTTIIVTNKIGLLNKIPTEEEKQILIEKCNKPFRKCIHFGIYFLLASLIISAFHTKSKNISSKNLWTILICFILATIDEFHQTFITGRTSTIFDIMIDTLGSITSVYLYQKNKQKQSYKNHNQ